MRSLTSACVLAMYMVGATGQGSLVVGSGVPIIFRGGVDDPLSSFTVALGGLVPLTPPQTSIGITGMPVNLRFKFDRLDPTAGAPAPPNFMVATLPSLFTSAGVTSIQVETSSATDFDRVAGVSGLADMDTVSLRGLLFNNGANPPALVAKKVRKR